MLLVKMQKSCHASTSTKPYFEQTCTHIKTIISCQSNWNLNNIIIISQGQIFMEKEIIEIWLKFLYVPFLFSIPFPGGAVTSALPPYEILKPVFSFWCVKGGGHNTESSAAGLLFPKKCDPHADCVFLLILGSTWGNFLMFGSML